MGNQVTEGKRELTVWFFAMLIEDTAKMPLPKDKLAQRPLGASDQTKLGGARPTATKSYAQMLFEFYSHLCFPETPPDSYQCLVSSRQDGP